MRVSKERNSREYTKAIQKLKKRGFLIDVTNKNIATPSSYATTVYREEIELLRKQGFTVSLQLF